MTEDKNLKVSHNFHNLKEGKFPTPLMISSTFRRLLTCFLGQEYVMTLQDTSVLEESEIKAGVLQNSDLMQEEKM